MGSGCSSHAGSQVIESRQCEGDPSLAAQLKIATSLVGKSSTQISGDKLDEIFGILDSLPVEDVCRYFETWLGKATSKAQIGLLSIMQLLIKHALWEPVSATEDAITSGSDAVGDIPRLSHIVSLCKEHLTVKPLYRSGLCVAIVVVSDFGRANRGGTVESTLFVPSLDKLVLLLRSAHLAHIESSAENCQQLRELETHVGLPSLRQHLLLLSVAAKAVILSLTLIPETSAPLSVVVKRDEVLLDAREQLPSQNPCVLMPYFESNVGTKSVKGRRVEGGEGHGPRKEFFIAATSDAIKKWSVVPARLPSKAPKGPKEGNERIKFGGNEIKFSKKTIGNSPQEISENDKAGHMVSNSLAMARVGDSISLKFSNGIELEHVITRIEADVGVSTNHIFEGDFVNGSATVCSCVLRKPVLPLFEFHRGTGHYWFSAYANELDGVANGLELGHRFLAFGKLLLLALVNRCKISFVLPDKFFHLLLNGNASGTLDQLKDFDSELHTSLKKCLKLSTSQFQSLKEVEGLPAEMTKDEYVAEKVRSTFTPQAMQHIRSGFWSLAQDARMDVSGTELQHVLCPMANLDLSWISIRDVFKVAMEEDMADCKPLVDAFWIVVDGLSPEDKRQFLLFLTGSESLPEPGTERLVIEMPFSAFSKEEHIAMLDMLPQAHTCSNTLELPNYYESLKESGRISEDHPIDAVVAEICKIFRAKLLIAIHESDGYELDAIANLRATTPTEASRSEPSGPGQSPQRRSNRVTSTPKASGYPSLPFVGESVVFTPFSPESKTIVTTSIASHVSEAQEPTDDMDEKVQGGISDVDTFLAELEKGMGTDLE